MNYCDFKDEKFVRTMMAFNRNQYQMSVTAPKTVSVPTENTNSAAAVEEPSKPAIQPPPPTVHPQNPLQENPVQIRQQPKQDVFETTSDTPKVPLNISSQPNSKVSFKERWMTKENMIIGGTGLGLVLASTIIGIASRKGLSRALKSAKSQLSSVTNELSETQKALAEIREQLSKLSDIPADLKLAKEEAVKKYRSLVQNATLNYDPLKPPADKEIIVNSYLSYARKKFGLREIIPFSATDAQKADLISVNKLKETLSSTGKVEITLPYTSRVKPVKSAQASIVGNNIPDLGQTVNSDFKLEYGTRISWSERKVARDIMQNFYDGHGNTLDGVRVSVKKLPNGQYGIKISGDATYDYENLQYLGSGKKLENPYNAGGFGEGAKILVANMLGNGDTSAVKYSCSNWELTFDTAKGFIRRRLDKVQTPINGNSIEFVTPNEKLANAILDSVNYFEHSKNPDFCGLHFNSKDFAFKILPKPDQKGNVYRTQRYELNKAEQWDNNAENLTLIFNRTPDPEKYSEIIGEPLLRDRDRQFLSYDDIKNYTQYFAHFMSDEDLVRAFVTTKPMWESLAVRESERPKAIYNFVEGLANEIRNRHIAIDYGDEKYVAAVYSMGDNIINMIRDLNYRVVPMFFDQTGLINANQLFNNKSVHKAIAPTAEEIKKLKLLEEGIAIIRADIDKTKRLHLQSPRFKFKEDVKKDSFVSFVNNTDDKDLIKIAKGFENENKGAYYSRSSLSESSLSDANFEACKKAVEEYMAGLYKKAAVSQEARQQIWSNLERNYKSETVLDIGSQQYLQTYKDFSMIGEHEVRGPRFIFDRNNELSKNTLGEAIIGHENRATDTGFYKGHWVDREYFDTATFNDLLATWLHEICHKSGGDGTPAFTYTLTDMLKVLLNPGNQSKRNVNLAALEEVFNSIKTTYAKAA